MTSPSDKIKEWLALSEEATEAPWVLEGTGNIPDIDYYADQCGSVTKDEAFIAASRNITDSVQKLLDERDELKRVLKCIAESIVFAKINGQESIENSSIHMLREALEKK